LFGTFFRRLDLCHITIVTCKITEPLLMHVINFRVLFCECYQNVGFQGLLLRQLPEKLKFDGLSCSLELVSSNYWSPEWKCHTEGKKLSRQMVKANHIYSSLDARHSSHEKVSNISSSARTGICLFLEAVGKPTLCCRICFYHRNVRSSIRLDNVTHSSQAPNIHIAFQLTNTDVYLSLWKVSRHIHMLSFAADMVIQIQPLFFWKLKLFFPISFLYLWSFSFSFYCESIFHSCFLRL
jgi:hypothetical protein